MYIYDAVDLMKEVCAVLDLNRRSGFAFSSYTVAGGAIRDTLLGQPVKDIDVVVSDQRLFGDVAWPGAEYGPTGGFSAVDLPGVTVRGHPINLIYRSGDVSITAMEEYHSMGVSNVYWSDGVLHISEKFVKDVRDRKHTVNRNKWGGVGDDVCEQRLQRYVDKITDKYPWPLR